MIRKTILLAVTLLMLFSYGPQAVINGLIIFGVLMVLSLPAVLSNSRYSIDAGIALLFLVMTSFNNVIVSLVTAYLIIALSPIQGELLKRDGLKIQIVFVAFRLLEAIAYFIILTACELDHDACPHRSACACELCVFRSGRQSH
jgi:hypothetical protein